MEAAVKAQATTTEHSSSLDAIFSSINLEVKEKDLSSVNYDYVTSEENKELVLQDDFARIGSALCAIFANAGDEGINVYNKDLTRRVIDKIDGVIARQVNTILKDTNFKSVEQQWRSVQDLYASVPAGSDIDLSLIHI